MRRTILIIGIVILLGIIGVGLYFLFLVPKLTSNPPNSTGSLPVTGNQTVATPSSTANGGTTGLASSFGIISNSAVLDYYIDAANITTAVEPDGTIIQIANGQVSTSSAIVMQNVISASFSYDGKKILVSFGDAANPQASVFDIAKKMWTPLPAGLQSPVWSPSDYRIAYTKPAARSGEVFATINAASAGFTPVVIASLHTQDLAIAWPAKNQMVFYTKPSAYVDASVVVYDLQKSTLTPIVNNFSGLDLQWSGPAFASAAPLALRLRSGANGLGGALSLVDMNGKTIQSLKLLTLPSKCSFVATRSSSAGSSTEYLYCAIPRDQNTLAISHLPDDYNQMSLFTSDDIYRIDLMTGGIDTIFNDATQNLDVADIKFFNNAVFFINRYDQKLYGVQLIAPEATTTQGQS
jgi:hypothetical protein